MSLRIELYAPEHADSVKRLNSRLREGNVQTGYLMPDEPRKRIGDSLDILPDVPFTKRQFVALEGDEVRGGFLLQEQQFEVATQRQWVANIQMPISEGLVDRKYATVAGRMLKLLAKKRPFLFAVGMGNVEAQFARLLAAMNWRVALVPFKFYIVRSSKFLQEIQPLHRTKARAAAANAAAWTGLGYVGNSSFTSVSISEGARRPPTIKVRKRFGMGRVDRTGLERISKRMLVRRNSRPANIAVLSRFELARNDSPTL